MLGLRFCARAFSSCGKRGPLFTAVRGPLTIAASLVAEHRLQTRRLSNCGSRAQLLRGRWDRPRPGLEPVSPALAGRFSTTAPPGKTPLPIFIPVVSVFGVFREQYWKNQLFIFTTAFSRIDFEWWQIFTKCYLSVFSSSFLPCQKCITRLHPGSNHKPFSLSPWQWCMERWLHSVQWDESKSLVVGLREKFYFLDKMEQIQATCYLQAPSSLLLYSKWTWAWRNKSHFITMGIKAKFLRKAENRDLGLWHHRWATALSMSCHPQSY